MLLVSICGVIAWDDLWDLHVHVNVFHDVSRSGSTSYI